MDNLVYLSWIGKLIKLWVLTPTEWRFIEWAIYTLEMWLITFILWGNFSNWQATLTVLFTWFAKTILSWIMMIIRAKQQQTQDIINTVEQSTAPVDESSALPQ